MTLISNLVVAGTDIGLSASFPFPPGQVAQLHFPAHSQLHRSMWPGSGPQNVGRRIDDNLKFVPPEPPTQSSISFSHSSSSCGIQRTQWVDKIFGYGKFPGRSTLVPVLRETDKHGKVMHAFIVSRHWDFEVVCFRSYPTLTNLLYFSHLWYLSYILFSPCLEWSFGTAEIQICDSRSVNIILCSVLMEKVLKSASDERW